MITNPIAIHELFIALGMFVLFAIITTTALAWFLFYIKEKEEEIPDAKPPTHTDNY